jgi:hypothetical protein
MAITRAQQARQMLEDGGMLVQPSMTGKRPGYRGEAAAASDAAGGRDAGRSDTGSASGRGDGPSGGGNGGGDDRREQESVTQTETGTVKTGKTGKRTKVTKDIRDRQRRNYEKQFFNKGQMPPLGSRPVDFKTRLAQRRNQNILNFVNRNIGKDLYRSGFLGPDISKRFLGGAIPTTGSFLSELMASYNPDLLENEINLFDEDSIREIGSVLSKTRTGITGVQGSALENLRKNIKNREELKEQGMTQDRFEELYPGPDIRDDDGPDPILPIIPKVTDDTEEDTTPDRNLAGLTPRIGGSIFDFTGLADGGRVAAAEGGIMELARQEMFLGGIAKGIKKGLKSATRAIKKVAKSPIGKAALLAAGGSFALGLGPFASGSTMFGGKLAGLTGSGFLKGAGVKNFFLKEGAKKFALSNLSGKGIASIIGGASLLPLLMGPKEEDEFDIESYYAANRLNPNAALNPRIAGSQFAFADGGRIGYSDGMEAGAMSEKEMKKLAKSPLYKGFKKMYGIDPSMAKENKAYDEKFDMFEKLFKKGFAEGGDVEPVAKKTMPLLDMDGQEMDLRAEGGFVPIGRMEKADDVPARLSKNEFVFTADAVRNAGDGNVDKGAEVMYNMMKNLESGGDVSEESQGLSGAREMFQTSKRLEEVL